MPTRDPKYPQVHLRTGSDAVAPLAAKQDSESGTSFYSSTIKLDWDAKK